MSTVHKTNFTPPATTGMKSTNNSKPPFPYQQKQLDKFEKARADAENEVIQRNNEIAGYGKEIKKTNKSAIISAATIPLAIGAVVLLGAWGAIPAVLSLGANLYTFQKKEKLEKKKWESILKSQNAASRIKEAKQQAAQANNMIQIQKQISQIDAAAALEQQKIDAKAEKLNNAKQQVINLADKFNKGNIATDDTFKNEKEYIEIDGVRLDKNMGLAHRRL